MLLIKGTDKSEHNCLYAFANPYLSSEFAIVVNSFICCKCITCRFHAKINLQEKVSIDAYYSKPSPYHLGNAVCHFSEMTKQLHWYGVAFRNEHTLDKNKRHEKRYLTWVWGWESILKVQSSTMQRFNLKTALPDFFFKRGSLETRRKTTSS